MRARSLLILAIAMVAVACSSSMPDAAQSSPPPPTSPAPRTTTTKPTTRTTTGTAPARANLDAVHLSLQRVASGLDSPIALAWRAHDPRMYVAEQTGRVRIVDTNGAELKQSVLTLAVSHGNEQGLLGMVFSPDGSKLYVSYTDPHGDTNVVEYRMRGDVADPTTRRLVLFQRQPAPNHNGGEILIGPDGLLYLGLGDGGFEDDPQNFGQNRSTLLSKILRINPAPSGSSEYSVPADNPFVNQPGTRPETWMWGLRNPWRFSFDRATGDVWIGDVGQNTYEEIDYAKAGDTGINWGWSKREGFHQFKDGSVAGARDPILETRHADGNCAIVGGYVYRGTAVPTLRGVYLFGDNCRTAITGVVAANGRVAQQRDVGITVDQLTSFGEDPSGELYAVSRRGDIYRIVAG